MFSRKRLLLSISTFSLLISMQSQAVSLESYLGEVTGNNSRIESTTSFLASADLQKSQSKILTTINAFSLLQLENDRKQPQFADFEGVSQERRKFQLGLEQNSSYGITHKLYTNYSYLNQKEASFIPNPKVANSALVYEFSFPLVKNFFGKIIQIQQNIIVSRNSSEALRESFEQRKVMNEAKTAYWRLKTAQEIVKSQEEIIQQGENFLKWTKGRVRDRLSEESDLRQAQAILDVRKFDLQKEKIELLLAQQAFNSSRQVALNSTIGELDDFPSDEIIPQLPPEKSALERPDLLSLESQLTAETLEYQRAAESSKMELNLIGSAATNGLSYDAQPDYAKTFSGKYPSYMIGMRLSVPLDRGSVDDVQKAALIKKRGLTAALHRNRFESVVELSQLRLEYEQLSLQLKVVRNLVAAQEAKLKTERERHRYGRSSTFQLLTFEQEYQQAKQDLIRTKGSIWQLSGRTALYLAEGN